MFKSPLFKYVLLLIFAFITSAFYWQSSTSIIPTVRAIQEPTMVWIKDTSSNLQVIFKSSQNHQQQEHYSNTKIQQSTNLWDSMCYSTEKAFSTAKEAITCKRKAIWNSTMAKVSTQMQHITYQITACYNWICSSTYQSLNALIERIICLWNSARETVYAAERNVNYNCKAVWNIARKTVKYFFIRTAHKCIALLNRTKEFLNTQKDSIMHLCRAVWKSIAKIIHTCLNRITQEINDYIESGRPVDTYYYYEEEEGLYEEKGTQQYRQDIHVAERNVKVEEEIQKIAKFILDQLNQEKATKNGGLKEDEAKKKAKEIIESIIMSNTLKKKNKKIGGL